MTLIMITHTNNNNNSHTTRQKLHLVVQLLLRKQKNKQNMLEKEPHVNSQNFVVEVKCSGAAFLPQDLDNLL